MRPSSSRPNTLGAPASLFEEERGAVGDRGVVSQLSHPPMTADHKKARTGHRLVTSAHRGGVRPSRGSATMGPGAPHCDRLSPSRLSAQTASRRVVRSLLPRRSSDLKPGTGAARDWDRTAAATARSADAAPTTSTHGATPRRLMQQSGRCRRGCCSCACYSGVRVASGGGRLSGRRRQSCCIAGWTGSWGRADGAVCRCWRLCWFSSGAGALLLSPASPWPEQPSVKGAARGSRACRWETRELRPALRAALAVGRDRVGRGLRPRGGRAAGRVRRL